MTWTRRWAASCAAIARTGGVLTRILADELTQSTGDSYIRAIESVGKDLNQPLDTIDATLETLTEILPKTGFDPTQGTSNISYDLKRRRVTAAVK